LERDEQSLTQLSVDIPSSYMDLIAALVEDSDESTPILANRINDLLSPFLRNENGMLIILFMLMNTKANILYSRPQI
jgi:hypothetical protein